MSCDFRILSHNIICSEKFKKFNGKFLLKDCLKDTLSHLSLYNIEPNRNNNFTIPLEWELCLLRIGCAPNIKKFEHFDICATHRYSLGTYFKPLNHCQYQNHSTHSNSKVVYRYVSYQQSIMLIEMKLNDPTIVIVTIGQALCRCCYDFISNSIQIHVASKNSIIQTQ
jgi:hypothetical protein